MTRIMNIDNLTYLLVQNNSFSYLMLFQENKKLTVAQRRDNLEKGPHNLIFHGMEPDWIEAEMDDDPDFIKDVIGQRMRNMIKDEVYVLIFILQNLRY